MTSSDKLVRFETGEMVSPVIGKPKRPVTEGTMFRSVSYFEGNEGAVRSGVWESTSGEFHADTTGYIEFGYIVKGETDIIDPDGTVHTLKEGDPFVMPEGYKGCWRIPEFVRKVYVISLTS